MNPDELPTPAEQEQLHDDSQEAIGGSVDVLLGLLLLYGDGELSANEFQAAVEDEIAQEQTRQYLLGVGGESQMEEEDRVVLDGLINDQIAYFAGFMALLIAGEISLLQASARLSMYGQSSNLAYNAGMGRRYGISWGQLPAWPCDGSTQCLTNCGCYWIYEMEYNDAGEEVRMLCYWRLGKTDNCEDCLLRVDGWNPYIIERRTVTL